MYDKEFYDRIRPGVQASAATIVPRVAGLFQPKKVIDIGCGEGWWLKEFAKAGANTVRGIDGHANGMAWLPFDVPADCDARYARADLSKPLPIDLLPSGHDYGLCVSLEVAEHIPADMAEEFVAQLCAFAPVVLFSAAIPGQGGVGHINERWASYWMKLFRAQRFNCYDFLRWEFWEDPQIEPWYRQNMLLFIWSGQHEAVAVAESAQKVPALARPDVVHPEIFRWRCMDIESYRGRAAGPGFMGGAK